MEDSVEENEDYKSEKIRVFIRIRPFINYENDENNISPISVEEHSNSIESKINNNLIYYYH